MQARRKNKFVSEAQFKKNWKISYEEYLRDLLNDPIASIEEGEELKLYLSPETMKRKGIPAGDRGIDDKGAYIVYNNKFRLIKSIQVNILSRNIILMEDMQKLNNKELIEKFSALCSALYNTNWSADNYFQYFCILDHFIHLIDGVISNKKHLTYEEIGQSINELGKKVYGTPPISLSVQAAVCGVIGALVGLVIGIVVGGASTFYAGGFGALPAAIATAFKGAALGVTLAQGATGGVLGCCYGFFSNKRNLALHEEKINNVHANLTQQSKDAVDAVFDGLKLVG
ncbi:MAG: hypothetical protein P4M14_05020 [Gammaproteobacteria bacterium]|nr:hypothetical protein [Gammaproteobacteria bacterium]